ncbi:MAG: ABC-2 family transporter protein [Candidatus Micrarchaeota archaeon]|nr:ABC-2 family transporter protein [Candidatus Micrarchaeota archaeon]
MKEYAIGFGINRYLSYSRLLIKSSFAYKTDFAIKLLLRIANPIIMLFVWTAIYSATHTSAINNFSLYQISIYFFIIAVVNSVAPSVSWAMAGDVRSGGVFTSLTRPIRYVSNVFTADATGMLVDTLTLGLPIFILLYFFLHLNLTLLSASLFLLSMGMMYAIAMMIEFLLGFFSFFTTDIGGIINMAYFIISFFGGGFVPLNLLPPSIAHISSVLPFQFMIYFPASILTGAVSPSQLFSMFPLAALWFVALLAANFVIWSRVRKHIDAVGV